MFLSRRQFHQSLLSALSILFLNPGAFAGEGELLEGRDWRRIDPPQESDAADKIEVLEFFSYGCPHCRDLNELITLWVKKLPSDVVFRRVPVTFGRAAWVNLAKLYLTLEINGTLEHFDHSVFTALHKEHIKLFTPEAIADWIGQQGGAVQEFTTAFESFDVETRLNRSEALAKRYQIDAVPTLIVAGRYLVLGNAAKTQNDLLTITDDLIAKARAEK